MEEITLVDKSDQILGKCEKLEAHHKGYLHRAFSILIINSAGEMLIHQRNFDKYHSGGLWTNACCSHPRYGESLSEAVHRRLIEELGFACPLDEMFSFHYRKEFNDALVENELDHVFIGYYDQKKISPDKNEVHDYRWISSEKLYKELDEQPEMYTIWFRIIMDKIRTSQWQIFDQDIFKLLLTLKDIAQVLNALEIEWAIGGSLLLFFKGIIDKPKDIDLMIKPNDSKLVFDALNEMGPYDHGDPVKGYATKIFRKYTINSIEVDVIGGFVITKGSAPYEHPFSKESIEEIEILDWTVNLDNIENWLETYKKMGDPKHRAPKIKQYLDAIKGRDEHG